jgi:AhpC/TSA antioxidant enzyme
VETLAQLRDKKAEFAKLGVKVACVVQGNAKDADELCGPFGLSENCVPDPEKQSYRKLGLDRAKWMELLRPSEELRARRKENRKAGFSVNLKRSMKSTCDILLLPGAALVARGGKILWMHRAAHVGDMPSADALLETTGQYL